LHDTHVGLNNADAGLNQPAGKQQRLAETGATVTIAGALCFLLHFESARHLTGTQHAECCCVVWPLVV
jgi:hypothetical protein